MYKGSSRRRRKERHTFGEKEKKKKRKERVRLNECGVCVRVCVFVRACKYDTRPRREKKRTVRRARHRRVVVAHRCVFVRRTRVNGVFACTAHAARARINSGALGVRGHRGGTTGHRWDTILMRPGRAILMRYYIDRRRDEPTATVVVIVVVVVVVVVVVALRYYRHASWWYTIVNYGENVKNHNG